MDEDAVKRNIKTPDIANSRLRTFLTRLRRFAPFAGAFFFAVLGVLIYNQIFPPPIPLSLKEIDNSIQQAMASATPQPAFSSEVYQAILPSLVFIQVSGEDGRKEQGIGSGVIINESADILTALHVIGNSSNIKVLFSDGSRSNAEVIAAEPEQDIAVLHPTSPPSLIVPAILSSLGGMRVGDEAYAVGSPFGLTASLSAGVISGFNRSFYNQISGRRLEGLIQFDTAVNPGNSGGPLLNRKGQVIGIVTGLINPAEENFFVGIGFAVPILTAVSTAGGPGF